jgi:hypothetical protein
MSAPPTVPPASVTQNKNIYGYKPNYYTAYTMDRTRDNYDAVAKTGQLSMSDLAPYMGKEVLVHLRYSTQGDVNAINCQPFTSDQLIFAHNGVVSEFVSDVYSDTHLIYQILNRGLSNRTLSWEDIPKFLQPWGGSNRFVAINPKNGDKHFVGAWPSQAGLGQSNPEEMVTHLPYSPTCNTYLPHERKAFAAYTNPMPASNKPAVKADSKKTTSTPSQVKKPSSKKEKEVSEDVNSLLMLVDGGSFDAANFLHRNLLTRVTVSYKQVDLSAFETSQEEMKALLEDLRTEVKGHYITSSDLFKTNYSKFLELEETFQFDCTNKEHMEVYNYIEELMDDFGLQVAIFSWDDDVNEAYTTLSELVACYNSAVSFLDGKPNQASVSLPTLAVNEVVQEWQKHATNNAMLGTINQALSSESASV